MINKIPYGVYPTMVTPYTREDKIDYDGVLALLDWYKRRSCDGIFAICQSSEIFFLSFEERLELLQFIMKNKPAGITIIASGHTEEDPRLQVEQAKAFIDTGIDAYVFISNRFARKKESDDVFLKNILNVVESLPEIALGIYECPYPYKRLLSPYVLSELAKTGKFHFLKDTCCDITQIKAKLKAVEGSDFGIYNANSATLLESLKLGCRGFSGVMGNFHPEIYAYLCKNFNKKPEEAQIIQDFLGFASLAECQMYPVNAKYYLSLDKVPISYYSRARSSVEFTENRKMEIDQLYACTNLFKKQIGID